MLFCGEDGLKEGIQVTTTLKFVGASMAIHADGE